MAAGWAHKVASPGRILPHSGSTHQECLSLLDTLREQKIEARWRGHWRWLTEPVFFQGVLGGCVGHNGFCHRDPGGWLASAFTAGGPINSSPPSFSARTDPFYSIPNSYPFDGYTRSVATLVLGVNFCRPRPLMSTSAIRTALSGFSAFIYPNFRVWGETPWLPSCTNYVASTFKICNCVHSDIFKFYLQLRSFLINKS